jgi:hypothetical protein
MALTWIAGECSDRRTCLNALATERGSYVIQAPQARPEDLAQLTLSEGETAVEIPAWLVEEIAHAHR